MEQFRFVFLILSQDYTPQANQARFESPLCLSQIYGVGSLEEACRLAREIADEGQIHRVELCGAFGPEGGKGCGPGRRGTPLCGVCHRSGGIEPNPPLEEDLKKAALPGTGPLSLDLALFMVRGEALQVQGE